ncbi:hypothetical protein [Synechococcus sp. PCC 7502]|uniref:hypothetical protein n=1 Tax=Synechococcus sp. PCC 7502 TaxID=1173263 RepID=UPI00059DF425|nr:hypothetical protein [Synechococcus sp. PCC 7502]
MFLKQKTTLLINFLNFRDFQEEDKRFNWISFLGDLVIITLSTALQCIWTSVFISQSVGFLNTLPTFVFLGISYYFAKTATNYRFDLTNQQKFSYTIFFLGFILTLRLPATISRNLEGLNWWIYLMLIAIAFSNLVNYFRERKEIRLFLITVLIVLFNACTHISLNSPYTYGFRVINHRTSDFLITVDNNTTWECPYADSKIAVSCDMRHFIASEKIFTEPDYKPTFSVLLQRFFYGYISSLIGIGNNRWIASFTINLWLWLFACVALYKTCINLNLSSKVARISMLCCATSFGFTYFVGQPSPHVASYAFASITIWATLEILNSFNYYKTALFILIIASGSLFYETYPLTLACFIPLFIYKKRLIAFLIIFLQFLLGYAWRNIWLDKILGTVGDINSLSNGSRILVYNLESWIKILGSLDISSGLNFIIRGIQAYIYGSFIVGFIALFLYIIHLFIKRKQTKIGENDYYEISSFDQVDKNKLFLMIALLTSALFILSMIFVAPQTKLFSIGNIQPRLSFAVYTVNTIAISIIASSLLKQYAYSLVFLTFIFANVDLTGLASISMFFDYGVLGKYWK